MCTYSITVLQVYLNSDFVLCYSWAVKQEVNRFAFSYMNLTIFLQCAHMTDKATIVQSTDNISSRLAGSSSSVEAQVQLNT